MKSESLQRWKLSKAVMWRWFLVWVWISSFIPPEIPMVVLVWAHELRATGADIAHLFMITCQSEKPWSFLRLITMEMKGLITQLLSERGSPRKSELQQIKMSCVRRGAQEIINTVGKMHFGQCCPVDFLFTELMWFMDISQ